MWPDRVSNPGLLALESDALPTGPDKFWQEPIELLERTGVDIISGTRVDWNFILLMADKSKFYLSHSMQVTVKGSTVAEHTDLPMIASFNGTVLIVAAS